MPPVLFFFFFNDTATTEIYTLSLHDALPISLEVLNLTNNAISATLPVSGARFVIQSHNGDRVLVFGNRADRKSTRLNSSHSQISYAVFCLKKKKKQMNQKHTDYIFCAMHRMS